jgi:hypothetical protein
MWRIWKTMQRVWNASTHVSNFMFWFGPLFAWAAVTKGIDTFSESPLWLSITSGFVAAVAVFLAVAVYIYIIRPHSDDRKLVTGESIDPSWSTVEKLELWQAACLWAGLNPPANLDNSLPPKVIPFLQRLKIAVRDHKIDLDDEEARMTLRIQKGSVGHFGETTKVSHDVEISQSALIKFMASETAKKSGDDENGFDDEFNYHVAKLETDIPKRDKSFDEAVTYIVTGHWGGNVARATMDGLFEDNNAIQRLRQAAVDGDIRVWAKQSPNSAVHVEIEPVFWETHQPDFMEFLRGGSRTESAELGATNERYFDLMVSRAEIERKIPRE